MILGLILAELVSLYPPQLGSSRLNTTVSFPRHIFPESPKREHPPTMLSCRVLGVFSCLELSFLLGRVEFYNCVLELPARGGGQRPA